MFGYIKLIFWASKVNFGDLASPYLISKLTGKKIIHKNFYEGKEKSLNQFWEAVKELNVIDLINITLPWESNLVAIGSILARGNKASKIWGSGFIDENDPFYGGKVFAVRGKYSAEKLVRMGYDKCHVYGDPALLLPLVYNPRINNKNNVGIISHFCDVKDLEERYGSQVKIISLASSDIEGVIDEILSCSFIYSTSLHGIIVSHAYGLPAVHIVNNKLVGDGIKFKDYFSSVDIPYYDGISLEEIDLTIQSVDVLKRKYSSICYPQKSIKEIQSNLLKSAPIKIKKEILKVINE